MGDAAGVRVGGIGVLQAQPPGADGRLAEALGPFHRQHGAEGQGLLQLLGKQLVGGVGILQPVEIHMHQARALALPRVVLGQGKARAGHRLVDAETHRQALHQGGFARSQIAAEQQQIARSQSPRQPAPQVRAGGRIFQVAAAGQAVRFSL